MTPQQEGKIADLCTKLHTTYRSMHILSKLSDLWGKCQLYAISCKSMQKKTILVQKKIKYFRYMWKQCNFFRSMHSTTMKYQTYVKFFKSIPGPGEHHYVQIFVQKIVISITRFKSEMYIGQSLSIYFRQASPKQVHLYKNQQRNDDSIFNNSTYYANTSIGECKYNTNCRVS